MAGQQATFLKQLIDSGEIEKVDLRQLISSLSGQGGGLDTRTELNQVTDAAGLPSASESAQIRRRSVKGGREKSAKQIRQEQEAADANARRTPVKRGGSGQGPGSRLGTTIDLLAKMGLVGPAITEAIGASQHFGSNMSKSLAKRDRLASSLSEAGRQARTLLPGGGGGGTPARARVISGGGGGGRRGGGRISSAIRGVSSGGSGRGNYVSPTEIRRQEEAAQREIDRRLKEESALSKIRTAEERQRLNDRLLLISNLMNQSGIGRVDGNRLTNTREELVNIAGGFEKRTLKGTEQVDRLPQILQLLGA